MAGWDAYYAALHSALIKRREALGLTQDALAARLGWSRRKLQHIEAEGRSCTAPELFRWAAMLGVPINFAPDVALCTLTNPRPVLSAEARAEREAATRKRIEERRQRMATARGLASHLTPAAGAQ
ncbi:helix-turn-helix transcriptional regulator [Telmatospirillum sp. J64-1]|uniref:helix-turn-helix transcriptional regulator n=1 Tax=Telmatospirillum sp. J64-1 TaxID=2502183 RepID=UPI00115EBE9D|nr:helix-turn-helix transcriptional regulator [Telmatospirillum sp. J64-1]